MAVTFLTNEDEKKYVKTINDTAPDENGNIVVKGEGIAYDNTVSGIDATTVQGAIDKLYEENAGYVLPVGGEELGGVKNGGNVVINADGTMTAPETEMTEEQISNAVSEWLTEHPEATTTLADNSVTPVKTTFVEAVPGLDVNGLVMGLVPSTWASNQDWQFPSHGTVIPQLFNGATSGYHSALIYAPDGKPMAFTGTVYVRCIGAATTTYYGIRDYMVIADDEDAINNPSFDSLSALKYSERISIFTIDGVENQQFIIKNDGTYEQVTGTYASPDKATDGNGYGIICILKFEIPEGKVGYLGATPYGTSWNNTRWLDGWNAVFPYDITDNPVVIVGDSTTDGNVLKVTEAYEDGFVKFIVQSPSFRRYFKTIVDSILPITTRAQTIGKSLWIGGDSLHQYSGGDGFATSGFVTNYNKYLGFKTVSQNGYAGSKWAETVNGGAIKRVTDLVAAAVPYDVFILAWGTNYDAGGDGTIDDEASNAEGCTMVAAMKWCITQLRTTFPKSAIGIVIPPPKFTDEGMKERGDLMIQVCELLHVPYVDMRRYLSIADIGGDQVHLGAGGAVKYGAAEAKLILEICPYGDPLT